MGDVAAIVLFAFGLAMVLRALTVLWRLRNVRTSEYTTSVAAISLLTLAIGLAALVAASWRSPTAVWVLVFLVAALPVMRTVLRHKKGL